MRLSDLNLAVVYINLSKRPDRRAETEAQLATVGLAGTRQPGINARWVRDARGYEDPQRYACALSKRLAIRRGRKTGAEAVLLLEDDVVFHSDLHERLEGIILPEDWEVFFLGCRHEGRPEVVSAGLVRCTLGIDHHAVIVRAGCYAKALRALSGTGPRAEPTIRYSDVKFSRMQANGKTYAAYPNLAWQKFSFSDNSEHHRTAYHEDGRQGRLVGVLDGIPEEMRGGEGMADLPELKAAVEQEKRESPAGQLPFYEGERLRKFEDDFPQAFYLNLNRRQDRRSEAEGQFARQELRVERQSAVDASRVIHPRGYVGPAPYCCALSHRLALRKGWQSGASSVVVFEDDVVLHPEFRRLAEALEIPDDWGVFFFGCGHLEVPEIVGRGVVRVRKIVAAHAYAVRRPWLRRVLGSYRSGGKRAKRGSVSPCDVKLSNLAGEIPMYAAFPNLAWQGEGHSDLLAVRRRSFGEDGRQDYLGRLDDLEEEMRRLIAKP